MRRGSLFFIGLLSAIVTITSLNIAFGRSGYYHDRYNHYGRFHDCDSRYDERYYNNKRERDKEQKTDSLNNNY